ncbi:MAG: DUF4126 domain-containing protein [Pseudomonadota bacterium]
MGIVETIAISMGLAWASGINLYATLATLGILGATGNMILPEHMQILADPAVIAAAGFMYCVEFFADKTPGVDTTWDTLHTFIRIPAGAVLAAMAMGQVSPAAELAALIVGGGLAGISHSCKAGTRVLINTSPEPFSNWTASVTEDVVVIGGLLTAIYHPSVFIGLLIVFILLAIWLLPKIWRGVKALFGRLRMAFGGRGTATDRANPAADPQGLFQPALLEAGQSKQDPPKSP